MNTAISKLRGVARKCARVILGKKILFSSRVLQTILAFKVSEGVVRDFNLPICFEYDKNSGVGTLLFYKGMFEEKEIEFISNVLKRMDNPIVLDIGANIGWHAVRWAVSCPDLRIYAFEPSAKTTELLKKNLSLNQVETRVKTITCALSDQEGIAEFHECEDNAFSSLRDTKRKKVVCKVSVPVTTVDKFVEEEGIVQIALIKIDVEGLETEVLHGAARTLETIGPDVFVEIYGGEASNPNPVETIRLMQSMGYKAFVWKDKGIVPYVSHSDKYFNYLFSKKWTGPSSGAAM